MAHDNLVLRTFYVDDDLDEQIRHWTGCSAFSSLLFRHWLAAGMRAANGGAGSGSPRSGEGPPVLCTAWIDARVDSRLRIEAFHRGVAKNLVAMEYLRLGREVAPPLKRVPPPN